MAITGVDIVRAESMVASSWPALNLSLSGRWLLGMADGVSGRANSLFFLDPNDDADHLARLDWMENTYRKVGLVPRVRLSPLAPAKIVKELQTRGYIFQKPTLTLRRQLTNLPDFTSDGINITLTSNRTDIWFDTFIKCNPHYTEKRDVLTKMLDSILEETTYILGYKGNEPVATAMSVKHINCSTVQNVATLPKYQRQGLARAVMLNTMAAAAEEGSDWCWVAVEKNNKPANSLYRDLGFEDFYSYIYACLDS